MQKAESMAITGQKIGSTTEMDSRDEDEHADQMIDLAPAVISIPLRACLGGRVMERIEGARIPHYSILNSEGF
jgi:hypothetical protein